MEQHVPTGSVYPSDGGEATEKTNETALDQSPETFLTSLFDRRIYDIRATENAAIGLFDRTPHPWPNTSVTGSDTHYAGALFEVNTVEVARDRFRRTKERWTGQIAVVLDDVGSKAKRPPVLPTAIIETRPGNEQWVYAFNRIERDRTLIETILQSAIAGGITDPEAGGIARITRLPGSLPIGKTHRAKLIWADWSRRFNPDALIEQGFQVARVTPTAPTSVGELRLSDETTEEGRNALERACQTIREAKPGHIANTINAQAYFIGQRVGAGLIALEEAEAALLSAARLYDRGEGHARNGLRDGIQRPIARPELDQEIEPFHPAPDGDRDAAIAAHPATIRAWADQNIPILQATKAVARAYAEIEQPDIDDPDRDQKLKAVAKAKRAIRKRIKDQFDLDFLPASKITKKAPITRVMLSGAQGVGKTRTVVGAGGNPGILHGAQGLISILFEPDHGKATEAKDDYDRNAPEGSPPSIHIWGRGSLDPDQPDETMCRLPDTAQRLAEKGVSVRKALCDECPFANVCGYLRQEEEIAGLAAAPEGVAIFAPHDFAFLPLPGFVEPDLAIFDERPRDSGVGDDVGLSFDDLSETLRSATTNAYEEADAQAANLRFIRPLQVALRDAGRDHPNRILAALRDRGIDRDHITGAIVGLKDFQDRETAHAMRDALTQWDFSGRSFNLQNRLEQEIEKREGKITRDLQTIFEALLIEIDKDRDDAIGIGVGDVTRNGRTSKGIVAVKLKRLRLGRVPFLHLDGTGDHTLAQAIFGAMDHEHHRVERSPGGRGDRIVQVVGTDFHNAGLIGGKGKDGKVEPYTGTWADYYDAQRRDVQKIISQHPGALVVGNKRVIAALKPEEYGAHSAHFGAIRGYNTWEETDTVLIVGREQPSPAAVERIARAYAAHGDADFESLGKDDKGKDKDYPKTTRGIRKRDGTGHPVKVAYHPNTWAERVLRSIRDTEIEQAIDRIRPIFKTRAIKVVVLSPVAVDLTVDQVTSWTDFRQGGSRIERALKTARLVPLSGREAARLLPGIWANRTTAQEDLSEAGLLAISLNRETYLQILPIRIGVVVTYKTEVEAGKRSREQTALIAAPPHEARAVLEALTGRLREFEVVKVFEPDQAAVEAAEAREERIAIAMYDGGLSEAEAAKVADGVKIPDRVELKKGDQVKTAPDIAKPKRRRRSGT